MVPPDDGPSLQTYVETRFNLLTESLKDLAASQASALGSAIEAAKASQAAADLRYEQRFIAQGDALSAAFLSQQVAMKTALEAAKEAVQAAQANADRAVSKSEAAADKRFESLNELRQTVNDVMALMMPKAEATNRFDAVGEKLDAINKRIDEVANRFNLMAGEHKGDRRTKDDVRSYVAVGVSILFLLLALATFIYARFN